MKDQYNRKAAMIKRFWNEYGFLIIIFLSIMCLIGIMDFGLRMQEKNPTEYKEIDGHEYVIYRYGFRGGITHSPNCHCLTNKVKVVK